VERIGCLASECGKEEAEIEFLEEEIKRKKTRCDMMEKECSRIIELLKEK